MFRHLLLVSAVTCALFLTAFGSPKYTDVVQTKDGPIRGLNRKFGGTKVRVFKGIPYAKPPVDDLRFKAPEPPEEWTEVRDAVRAGHVCHQPHKELASEDCLTLNVYAQPVGENGLKPVLVVVHGTGFVTGGALDHAFGPHYLLKNDIVVVTFNYRLGILGFLSTNTSDASGNWGLKDQVAALKWVQENIEQFGGDPKQVTLYGHSSGAACAHLHMFSQLSEGLFHKVILASGSATNPWMMSNKVVDDSIAVAKALGASPTELEDPAKRIEFVRAAYAEEKVKRMRWANLRKGWYVPRLNDFAFVPMIEIPGTEGAFLTERPEDLLREGKFTKVPMMIGVTNLEGVPYLLLHHGNLSAEFMKKVEENVCSILPDILRVAVKKKEECAKVAEEIRAVYFDGKPFDSSELNFVNLRSDILVVLWAHVTERLHTKAGDSDFPVYKYLFTFEGELTRKKLPPNLSLPGAANGDDMRYIFKTTNESMSHLESDTPDGITKNRMVHFISNFVHHGNPTPSESDLTPVKWEPTTKEESKTLIIDNELKMENEFLKSRMDLWDKLYAEYTGSPLFS